VIGEQVRRHQAVVAGTDHHRIRGVVGADRGSLADRLHKFDRTAHLPLAGAVINWRYPLSSSVFSCHTGQTRLQAQ
jgi:hypothetical protein